jgi:hypothetical protein
VAEAAAAWGRPSRPAAATGAALLAWVAAALDTDAWAGASSGALTTARGDLRSLAESLAAGAGPDVAAPVLGEEEVSWRLHFDYTLTPGAAEALRVTARIAAEVIDRLQAAAARVGSGTDWADIARQPLPSPHESVAAEAWPAFRSVAGTGWWIRVISGGALDPGTARVSAADPERAAVVTDVRYGAAGGGGRLMARARAGSEIRRRFARPALVDAWGLFIQSSAARRTADPRLSIHLLADLYRRVLVAAADLAIHQGTLDSTDALAGLRDRLPVAAAELEAEVRGIALRPVEAAGAVLVYREWERLAADWPGGHGGLAEAVLADGLAHPALLRWKHGVDG